MGFESRSRKSRGRRRFLGAGLASAAGGALTAMSAEVAADGEDAPSLAKIVGLSPEGAPVADVGYTAGILAQGQRVIFVSGQGPEDLKADMETQIRQTFQRIGRVLQAAGASFRNVVMVRSYFVHLSRDLATLRKVRREFLSQPYPASTAVGVTELAIPGLEVEIEAIAVL